MRWAGPADSSRVRGAALSNAAYEVVVERPVVSGDGDCRSCHPLTMSSSNARARRRKAGELRRLTDAEAAAVLDVDKTVSGLVEWVAIDKRFVRMDVQIHNPSGENLKLTAKVNLLRPGASSWALVWGSKGAAEHEESIRRLDMRGRHRNPDGELWLATSHKHRWSSVDNNDWAYTPDDIPHEMPGSVVSVDNYREVFEAFAAECNIGLADGYEWSDPPMDFPPEPAGLWEA